MMREQIAFLFAWARSRAAGRDEDGFTAVEWTVIALGVIAIATLAVAAVKHFVVSQTHKLGG